MVGGERFLTAFVVPYPLGGGGRSGGRKGIGEGWSRPKAKVPRHPLYIPCDICIPLTWSH